MSDRHFGSQAKSILEHASLTVGVKTIFAGKFRRFSNVSLFRQLTYPPIVLRNLGDIFLVIAGYFQSLFIIAAYKPDVVFTKGGFVCLPVGLAAVTLRIPLVIHDSDSHAGLTNRILARFARTIATGAPLENYEYDRNKSFYVGIPVDTAYRITDKQERRHLKSRLGFPDVSWPLVVVTGGGLGSQRINTAFLSLADELADRQVSVLHIAGRSQYVAVDKAMSKHPSYIVKPFIAGLADAINAADIVVTRAGATTLAEVAASEKPTIIIPSRVLAGGHQLKNAAVYEKAEAAIVIDEKQLEVNPAILLRAIELLLTDEKRAAEIAKRFHGLAKADAASSLAVLITDALPRKRESSSDGVGE